MRKWLLLFLCLSVICLAKREVLKGHPGKERSQKQIDAEKIRKMKTQKSDKRELFLDELGIDIGEIRCQDDCPNSWVGDGECDSACDSWLCAYDGGDCIRCHDDCPRHWMADGECDSGCDHAICAFDGGDCMRCSDGCPVPWIADGDCDDACNVPACAFDGGDCGCNEGCELSMIGNGQCNDECNVGKCGFDGGDCGIPAGCSCELSQINNGLCEPECNVLMCGYDGLDCLQTNGEVGGGTPGASRGEDGYMPYSVQQNGCCNEIDCGPEFPDCKFGEGLRATDCYDACMQYEWCTQFVFSNDEGGWCWLETSCISEALCSNYDRYYTLDDKPYGKMIYHNCTDDAMICMKNGIETSGDDCAYVATSFMDCRGKCDQNDWCTQYVWKIDGNTTVNNCWLQSKCLSPQFAIGFDYYYSRKEVCITASAPKKVCVFPFVYNGITFDTCTAYDAASQYTPWCATTVNEDGTVADWGYCDLAVCEVCKSENADAHPCIFPFVYFGYEFNSCTEFDAADSYKPWCATAVGAGNEKTEWAYCNMNTCPTDYSFVKSQFICDGDQDIQILSDDGNSVSILECAEECKEMGILDFTYGTEGGDLCDSDGCECFCQKFAGAFCPESQTAENLDLYHIPFIDYCLVIRSDNDGFVQLDVKVGSAAFETIFSGNMMINEFRTYCGYKYVPEIKVELSGLEWKGEIFLHPNNRRDEKIYFKSGDETSHYVSVNSASISGESIIECVDGDEGCNFNVTTCATDAGKGCVFPFTYNGIDYDSCTQMFNGVDFWCATEVNEFGEYFDGGLWGVCDMDTCAAKYTKQAGSNCVTIDCGDPNWDCKAGEGMDVEQCYDACSQYDWCSQFTLSNDGGGWCWLERSCLEEGVWDVYDRYYSLADKPYGKMMHTACLTAGTICEDDNGQRIIGNDCGIVASDLKNCMDTCDSYDWCTQFVWRISGGTDTNCWLQTKCLQPVANTGFDQYFPKNKDVCISQSYPQRPCIFPFTYWGHTFDSCTTFDSASGDPWCATVTTLKAEKVEWAYCNMDTCSGTERMFADTVGLNMTENELCPIDDIQCSTNSTGFDCLRQTAVSIHGCNALCMADTLCEGFYYAETIHNQGICYLTNGCLASDFIFSEDFSHFERDMTYFHGFDCNKDYFHRRMNLTECQTYADTLYASSFQTTGEWADSRSGCLISEPAVAFNTIGDELTTYNWPPTCIKLTPIEGYHHEVGCETPNMWRHMNLSECMDYADLTPDHDSIFVSTGSWNYSDPGCLRNGTDIVFNMVNGTHNASSQYASVCIAVIGCDGVVQSGLIYDPCGVCGGDGSSCAGCDGIPNSGIVNDECGVCDGDNSTCAGCDGVPNSGAVIDECGICAGDNTVCAGCDGIPNSGIRYDPCGVCDGDSTTCVLGCKEGFVEVRRWPEIETVIVQSFQECSDYCAAQDSCYTFTFDKNGICIIRNEIIENEEGTNLDPGNFYCVKEQCLDPTATDRRTLEMIPSELAAEN